ncbi:MAG: DUF1611 domain-containing protein [Planctomycetota bacterium]
MSPQQPIEPAGRRLAILTEGHTEPVRGKTATCLLRYRPEEVVSLLDSTQVGKTAQDLLGVGGDTPVVGKLDDAPDANTLMIGIASAGGRFPDSWRPVLLQAIRSGMDVISGMHQFLCDDAEFARAAEQSGAKLIDVRKNDEHEVANRTGLREDCLRLHTVGQDCSVGKMLVAMELTIALNAAGRDAKFIATGQTGIMVEGDGCPVDCVVADFISGAVEKQVLANQHREIVVVEGQGSISHPRYSAVTLGILHGCVPHALVLCYEVGRTEVHGMPGFGLKPLDELLKTYEHMASLQGPCSVIGVAMNSRKVSAAEAEDERARIGEQLGLPVCDVVRDGPADLVAAVEKFRPQAVAT